jgi:hypothetical protein
MANNKVKTQFVIDHWVTQSTRNTSATPYKGTIEFQIQSILNKQTPLTQEHILYRAHLADSPTILPRSWFSTGKDLNTVLAGHTKPGQTCCIFTIHVMPGVRVLDIDTIYENPEYAEGEVVVNRGGIFYKDAGKMLEGFVERAPIHGITHFETWYFPRTIEINTALAAELAMIPLTKNNKHKNNTAKLKLLYNIRGIQGGKRTRTRRKRKSNKQ